LGRAIFARLRGVKNLPRTLLWIAGAAWLASWLLPVVEGMTGAQAFRAVFEPPFGERRGWEDQAAQWLSGLTNFVFIGLFAWLASGRTMRAGLLIRAAVACFVVNLYWFVQCVKGGQLDQLLVGYYAWMLAYALMIAIGLSGRRTSRTPTAGTRA
jgi:hypothetical protein